MEGETMDPATTKGSVLLEEKAITILRSAYTNLKQRELVMRDPKSFLAKHGIVLPESAEVRLYERKKSPTSKPRPHGGTTNRPTSDRVTRPPVESSYVTTPGFESWWESTHDGCPYPLQPYTTTEKVEVVDLWGCSASGKDWVPDHEGSSMGHWELTGIHWYPMISHIESRETHICR
jgi:hypothetical protein